MVARTGEQAEDREAEDREARCEAREAGIVGRSLEKSTANYIIAILPKKRPELCHVNAARPQERGPQGHAAAAQDHQPVRTEQGASPERRGCLSTATCRWPRRRPCDDLSRADAVRA